MGVTHDDVRHIAELARLSVGTARLDELASELNAILGHMDVLGKVDTSGTPPPAAAPGCTHLRSDSSGPIPLAVPRESFAPIMRDGFFIVPRLATHEELSSGGAREGGA